MTLEGTKIRLDIMPIHRSVDGRRSQIMVRYDIDNLTDNRVYWPRCFRVGVFHTRVVYTVPARKATLNRIFQVMNGMLVKRR